MRTPVILVPGVLGTSLVDPEANDFPVWGSYKGSFFYREKYEDLDLSILDGVENRLRPGEVLWTFPVIPRLLAVHVYETFARALEEIGYRRATPGGLHGLRYDFRKGLVAGARALEAAIAAVRESTGAERVHVVGHCYGSSVIRYFLRYGGADVLADPPEPARPGAKSIATFFAAGAPYAGSLRALEEMNHGFAPGGPVGRRILPHHVSTSVSAYELLRFDPDLAVDGEGRPANVDVTDTAAWEGHAWGPFQPAALEALQKRAAAHRPVGAEETRALVRTFVTARLGHARRASKLLAAPDPRDAEVHTITYATGDHPTLARAILGRKPCFTYEDALRHAPALARQLSVPGDGYLPVDEVRALGASGQVVVAAAKGGHRQLLASPPILAHIQSEIRS